MKKLTGFFVAILTISLQSQSNITPNKLACYNNSGDCAWLEPFLPDQPDQKLGFCVGEGLIEKNKITFKTHDGMGKSLEPIEINLSEKNENQIRAENESVEFFVSTYDNAFAGGLLFKEKNLGFMYYCVPIM